MNTFEIRQQITQSLEDISPEYLVLVADFVEFLKYKQRLATTKTESEASPVTLDKPATISSNSSPPLRGSTAKDLLEFVGTWEEDDIDEPIAEIKPVNSSNKVKQLRPFALCAGEFVVPEDFNEPLPENILNQFEGE